MVAKGIEIKGTAALLQSPEKCMSSATTVLLHFCVCVCAIAFHKKVYEMAQEMHKRCIDLQQNVSKIQCEFNEKKRNEEKKTESQKCAVG